jgi:hypothetical protein
MVMTLLPRSMTLFLLSTHKIADVVPYLMLMTLS